MRCNSASLPCKDYAERKEKLKQPQMSLFTGNTSQTARKISI